MTIATVDAIRALPKLEMHIHLEGTFDPQLVARLAEARGVPLQRPLDDLYDLSDIGAFLETLDWVCSLVASTEEAQMVADNFGRRCRDEGICYTEVIINPTHWAGLRYQELLPALSATFDAVETDYGVDVRLLPSILRQQSAQEAEEMVAWMGERAAPRIVGLSVDGNEAAAGRTGERFARAYAMARELGFGVTAHAGESSGADGVRDALDLLKVQRIDHGVRAADEPELLRRLVDEDITLNVCLRSNCSILYPSIESHPFPQLLEAGVKMTLNTDDPVVLNTELCDELAWAAGIFDFTLEDIAAFQYRAVDSAFCDDTTRSALRERIGAALAAMD
ncbi:adenosine deaminase [Mangrovimicrobium sediminis]|uniref:Adenosine deaminase n=1 Tax=Mangrovimicrobium sediminis TaxID=2562682 RepID=A0A4Z0M5B8_9GAMM|nr:adenosine deaminase [Haliea sp. SAOS-164]TGD74636.1 adenosine deaminase [Haliea sp. SAOS-164]